MPGKDCLNPFYSKGNIILPMPFFIYSFKKKLKQFLYLKYV